MRKAGNFYSKLLVSVCHGVNQIYWLIGECFMLSEYGGIAGPNTIETYLEYTTF